MRKFWIQPRIKFAAAVLFVSPIELNTCPEFTILGRRARMYKNLYGHSSDLLPFRVDLEALIDKLLYSEYFGGRTESWRSNRQIIQI